MAADTPNGNLSRCDFAPELLIDLVRFPLLEPESARYAEAVNLAQEGITAIGAAELDGFLSPAGVAAVLADSLTLEQLAWRSDGPATAYLTKPNTDAPLGHPTRWLHWAAVGAVAWDLFPSTSPLRRLYEWDPLLRFIEAVLDRGELHRYADPLGGLNLATMGNGDELQWHFDQTDFVVSLAVRDAEDGGDFEVVPRIRTPDDEHFDDVAALLDGDSSRAVTLPMQPGTLLIFEGRYSIHRVTPIQGATTRLVGLFGYDTKPGTMSSNLLKRIRYGRTEPAPS